MSVLTAKGISSLAIELLSRKLVLPKTVSMVPGNEFVGPNGGTITVRVPQPSAARTQGSAGAALTADDVSEIPVDVSLSHIYHLKNISDQEGTYSLEDFGRQITKPQVDAVAAGAEGLLVTIMNGLAVEGSPTYEFDITPASGTEEDETRRVLLEARKFLSQADAPAEDRWLACGSDVFNRVLKLLTPVDFSGSTDALRNAIAGRVYGFNVIEVPGMDVGEAVAYHKSAFAMAIRAPQNPKGATQSAAITGQGLALRQVFQYDAGTAQDQSLVSTFAGAAAVYEDGTGADGTDNQRFVKLQLSAA